MNEIVKLAADNPDSKNAEDIKAVLLPALSKICDILDDARRLNLVINFNVGQDMTGKNIVSTITIARHF